MKRKIDRIVVTEADLREQVRDLCKLFGWKMYLTKVSLNDILYLCLTKTGKPVWNILSDTGRHTVKNATMRGISMIRQGMPIIEQKNMVSQEFFGQRILRLSCILRHIVIIVAEAGRNCLLYLGKGNSGLTTLFHFTGAVKMLRKILLPAVIPAMLQNGEVFALSNGQGNGSAAKIVEQPHRSISQRGFATDVIGKVGIHISEKEFSTQVEDLLGLYRWVWCHFRPARTKHGWVTALSGYPGFPDYFALKDGVMLVFELKSDKGKVTEYQRLWHDELKKAGKEVFIFRPNDIEHIARLLRI